MFLPPVLYTTGCPDKVGNDDGKSDRVVDGLSDGIALGPSLGDTDGVVLGEADGIALGTPEGEELGVSEGMELGASDGTSEGIELGASDGTSDGIELGVSDGIELGRSEGDALGALVVGTLESISVSPCCSTMKALAPITNKSSRTDTTVSLASLKASIQIVLFPLVAKYGSGWNCPSSFPLIA